MPTLLDTLLYLALVTIIFACAFWTVFVRGTDLGRGMLDQVVEGGEKDKERDQP
jgi:hypothetical protein